MPMPQVTVFHFNPRSREGSDRNTCYFRYFWLYFNPRSREGSDRHSFLVRCDFRLFQSTLPRRERPVADVVMDGWYLISIHAPAKGATLQVVQFGCPTLYFNPRSREGSDFAFSPITIYHCISIHAPAKGATQKITPMPIPAENFNPRSREGSDADNRQVKIILVDFNPRSREGSDARSCTTGCVTNIFQSTLPRRERQSALLPCHRCEYDFNPRSREGSDRQQSE